jgi:hypothetical protein
MTLNSKLNVSIEMAFSALLSNATKVGLQYNQPMGLMYLPTQELSDRFIESCKDIMNSLGVKDAIQESSTD